MEQVITPVPLLSSLATLLSTPPHSHDLLSFDVAHLPASSTPRFRLKSPIITDEDASSIEREIEEVEEGVELIEYEVTEKLGKVLQMLRMEGDCVGVHSNLEGYGRDDE